MFHNQFNGQTWKPSQVRYVHFNFYIDFISDTKLAYCRWRPDSYYVKTNRDRFFY
jgi:hypothetical protein